MATVAGRECKLLSSSTELEEEHEDEIVGRNIVGAAAHLKCHHLVHSVWIKHLGYYNRDFGEVDLGSQ